MKFMLDQGLPRSAATLLAAVGHNAAHVGDLDMAHASDAAIIARAQSDDRVIVTLDADFHALIALSGLTTPSAIRI